MKNFKCYNWESYIPDKECATQCNECLRHELMTCDLSAYPLPKRPTGFDEDGSPLPGDLREIHPDAIWNDKKMEGIKNVINNHKNKEVYTRNQMILFAGYCMGKLRREPDKDVGEIVDEFREKFYIK